MTRATRSKRRSGARRQRSRGVQGPVVSRDAFPHIVGFFRAYLHEDWALDYGSAVEARDAFLADCAPAERRAFREEGARLAGALSAMDLPDARHVLNHVLGSAWQPATRSDIDTLLAVPGDRP